MQSRKAEEFRPDPRQQYTEVNFLKSLRGKDIHIELLNGANIIAKLKGWDRFHIFVERDGAESMIFKQHIGEIAGRKKEVL